MCAECTEVCVLCLGPVLISGLVLTRMPGVAGLVAAAVLLLWDGFGELLLLGPAVHAAKLGCHCRLCSVCLGPNTGLLRLWQLVEFVGNSMRQAVAVSGF